MILKAIEYILLAMVPLLLMAMVTMMFIPTIMFEYVLPVEKEAISIYKELK
jgi:hypothetical protein